MTVEVSNPSVSIAYKSIKDTSFQLKNLSVSRSSDFSTGTTEVAILALVDNLTAQKGIITAALASVDATALTEQGQKEEANMSYDVVAELPAMLAAVDAVLANIDTNIPAPRSFTGPQMAVLIDDLDNLTATFS